MSSSRKSAALALVLTAIGTGAAQAEQGDAGAIRATLAAYQHALNTAAIDAVPPLYTRDGVLQRLG